MFDQRQRLFAAAAEDEGVAAFQAEDAQAVAGQLHQPVGDIGLLGRRLAAAFSGEFQPAAFAREAEDVRPDQRVIDDHVGMAQRVPCVKGQQAGISRAGASEPDPSGLELGKRAGMEEMRGSLPSLYTASISHAMTDKPDGAPNRPLRRGWTTGACATAATKAAYTALLTGRVSRPGDHPPARRRNTRFRSGLGGDGGVGSAPPA